MNIRLSVIFISIVFMIALSGCATVIKDFTSGDVSMETNSVLITDDGVRLVELDGEKRVSSMGNLMQERMDVFPIQPGPHRVGVIFANSKFDSFDTAYVNGNFEKGKYYAIKAIFDYKTRIITFEINEETDPKVIEKVNKLLK